jgi:hypothetical protein
MNIQQRQNESKSIAKLAAQRLLYWRAKAARDVGICMVGILGLLALTATVIDSAEFSYAVTLAALFFWFIDQFVIKELENKFKTEAAIVQEAFDCYVLDLAWPEHKRIKEPTPDRIKELAAEAGKYPKLTNKLEDWYPPSSLPGDALLAKAHCQRTNSWWDASLRRRWLSKLKILFWIFIAAAVLLAIITGITVAKLVVLVSVSLRILAWGISELRIQHSAIERVDGIHRILSGFSDAKPPEEHQIRNLQDEIFEHRRSNSPVPDWFYWLNRNAQEEIASKSE